MGRRLKRLLFISAFPLVVMASHLHWMGNYDKALQQAIAAHKPLLVLVVKKDGKSNPILQKALMNQPYVFAMNRHFVSVIVTYEGGESYPIEMYYTTVFPTLFFVDSSREVFLTKPLYGEDINVGNLAKIMQDLGIIPAKKR